MEDPFSQIRPHIGQLCSRGNIGNSLIFRDCGKNIFGNLRECLFWSNDAKNSSYHIIVLDSILLNL